MDIGQSNPSAQPLRRRQLMSRLSEGRFASQGGSKVREPGRAS